MFPIPQKSTNDNFTKVVVLSTIVIQITETTLKQ